MKVFFRERKRHRFGCLCGFDLACRHPSPVPDTKGKCGGGALPITNHVSSLRINYRPVQKALSALRETNGRPMKSGLFRPFKPYRRIPRVSIKRD